MVEPFSYTLQQPIIWVAPHDPTLPIPWKGLIDPFTGWLYFWNPVTNVTQYERPAAPLHHHQFYLQQNPYPWLSPHPQYSLRYPKPISTSHSPGAWLPPHPYPWPQPHYSPHWVTIPFNHPRHRPFSREKGEDRISELPDELISHILCFLPTISAVRTTVLSKRWNNLWTHVRHLDFDIYRDMNTEKISYRERFEKLVYCVFLRLSSSDIGKFLLRGGESFDSTPMYDWICAAVSRNVVELDLRIVEIPDPPYLRKLPKSLFSCKSLKVLKLWVQSIAVREPPTSAGSWFPSLKIFHVTVIGPNDNESVVNLLSYFPVLDDLSIHVKVDYWDWLSGKINVKVSTPELKTLRLSMELAKTDYEIREDLIGQIYEIVKQNSYWVDAPKLENLEVIQIPLSNYILENPKSVVNASIAFDSLAEEEDWPSFPDSKYQILTGISNVKCLSLSAQPFAASNLPVFGNLNQLRLVLRNRHSWESLTELLHKTPKLEDLDLVLEDVRRFGTKGEEDYPELEWNPPELVPDCLSSNLKTISIRGFEGLQVETKLAKYMLLRGCHLNKMTIYTCMFRKEEACDDLLTLPRAETCQVEFKELRL